MRKTIVVFAVFALLVAATAYGLANRINASAAYTDSALVKTTPVEFYGLIITTDGTNANSITVYDNSSAAASGRQLIPTTRITTGATDRVQSISFNPPVMANQGVYVVLASSGVSTYTVYTAP